ncbi:DUF3231 family protein [Oceanobacillus senegalensis]|uniref:DUF3231 family protein n=1 Tax=Oceanobacillus senegalensis TaxID=1936063 RepID=UPI000A314175|nr:DUF3231 family protein [Oceanobacillus senegalensis]
MNEKKIPLTSAEIAGLWTGYMNDSMSICILKHMLKHIQHPEIKTIVQFACDISTKHIEQLLAIFKEDHFAVPNGFTEQDVNMDAPWLFTDMFCLTYVNHMAKVGMISYSGFISMSTRKDIRHYFTGALSETSKLYNESTDIASSMGINARHPIIEVPHETDYVDSKKYFSGLNPFSENRPLNAIEISHLYQNIMTNSVGIKLCLAFAQTSPTNEVQEFMLRAKDISKKHVKHFVDTLLKDEIQTPHLPDVSVSDSTSQTFSDKLTMFHMSLIMAAGIGNYATAGGASQRSDLMINYERLSLEVARLAKSGADIMITNNWLEQPPGIKDKDKLARYKFDTNN